MIPLKLQLKNFLSYGDAWTTIDFTPYHFICLSGKNGHGKSALLDALTWVLWGQARKVAGVARADDALVHLGQRSMTVILQFMCRDQCYTVRRELVLYQDGPKVTLDFGILDAQGQRTRSLTDKTVRLTQERIQEVVGLDFDSFANSVFLRQGQSNEFSKKTAQERKQMVATILGIDQYERMRKRALDKLRRYESERDGLKQVHAHLHQEYQRSDEVKRLFAACEQSIHAVQTTSNEITQRLAVLAEQRAAIINAKTTRITMQQELDAAKLVLQSYVHQQELGHINRIQEYEVACAAARAREQALVEKTEQLKVRIAALERDRTAVQQQLGTLSSLAQLKQQEADRFCAARIIFEKRKECYQRMLAYGNSAHNELKLLKQQRSDIDETDSAHCPLCHQALTQDNQQTVQHDLAKRIRFYEQRLARLGTFVHTQKNSIAREHESLAQLDQNAQQATQAAIRADELRAKNEVLAREVAALRTELETTVNVYNVEQQAIAKVRAEQQQIKTMFDQRLKNDERYRVDKERVDVAEQKIIVIIRQISLMQEEDVVRQEQALNAELVRVHEQNAQLLEQKGRLTQELDHVESVRLTLVQQTTKLHELETACSDYATIADIFGKDGVQALLIESVIPELEDEANDILGRLTDNQARIFIESLRDLRSGGTRETLDIKIADSAGIRAYELFSGGEAFRIDFAIRIALSKLLARRAGASLQTLIVDEGFGSQDEDGLALIIDMLYKIQDYFAKIIIVSHLPFLKDHAPVHFMVEKLAGGSVVRVIEQG
jgi:exonuclease SbcC